MHWAPPFRGAGKSQALCLLDTLVPHVSLQAPHVLHPLQYPSTETNESLKVKKTILFEQEKESQENVIVRKAIQSNFENDMEERKMLC